MPDTTATMELTPLGELDPFRPPPARVPDDDDGVIFSSAI